jgi:acetyl esterase/lipase
MNFFNPAIFVIAATVCLSSPSLASTPLNANIISVLAYGNAPAQRLDIYAPRGAQGAAIIMMVHGGAWQAGDKASIGVVANKVKRWVSRGLIFVSVNYRLLPQADPLQQAEDVAKALAMVQTKAASWGGDPTRIILMGHSSGAHLVALVASTPRLVSAQGAQPWLGSIVLDSAALDVVTIMQSPHPRFYDAPFGDQAAYWHNISPWHQLSSTPAPILLVCASERKISCLNAQHFATKAASLQGKASVLPVALTHMQINHELGKPGAYTRAVEAYMHDLGIDGV